MVGLLQLFLKNEQLLYLFDKFSPFSPDGSQKENRDLALTVGCWNSTLAERLRSLEKQVVSILCLVCNLQFLFAAP